MGIKTGMVLSGVTRVSASDATIGLTASQASALDAVISDSHDHSNKSDLDKLSSESDNLQFDHKPIKIPLTESGW